MNIGVNTRLLLPGTLEGIGRFTYEVLSRMTRQHPENQFYFFFDRPYDKNYVFTSNVTPVIIWPRARTPLHWYWWFEVALPAQLQKYNIDVFFSPEMYTTLNTSIPSVMAVHDLAFFHFPYHFKWYHRFYLQNFLPKFLRKADRIACVSNATLHDVEHLFPETIGKTFLAENGPTPGFRPFDDQQKQAVRDKTTCGAPYFIYLGSIHPRKNIPALIEAYNIFRSQNKDTEVKLVLVGRRAWNTGNFSKAKNNSPFAKDIIELGVRKDASSLLASSEALIYISLFEGFGIPILEAFSVHIPVIVSNQGAIKEVAGEAAILVDPTDCSQIALEMENLYRNHIDRDKLIKAGLEKLRVYNWDRTARKIYQQIKELFTG